MIKTVIKLKNGTVIEVTGSTEETEKILALYTGPVESIFTEGEEEPVSSIAPSVSSKYQKALAWARQQISRYVQPCGTPGCKYNYVSPGADVCKIPNPRADDDDIKKENHENYHPFWNFYCMRFVRTCFGAPNGYAKAEDMFQALSRASAIHTDGDIPEGALVFWHWTDYGHIGVHSGGGNIIHTGVNPSKKKVGVRESPLTEITEVLDKYNHYEGSRTSYLGWAHPPENWLKN